MSYKDIQTNTDFLLKSKYMVLSENRKAELKKITMQCPGFSCQGNLGYFFDLFLICEATARKLIFYYKKETFRTESQIYTIKEVKAALNLFSLLNTNDFNFVDFIFKSGIGSRGNKTCRQLRNDYIHNLSLIDRSEIENRNVDLIGNMNKWIKLFQ